MSILFYCKEKIKMLKWKSNKTKNNVVPIINSFIMGKKNEVTKERKLRNET